MSGYDIFAWMVPVILLAVIVLVFWLMGSLPGARRETTRPSPAGSGHRGGLDDADLEFALWPVALIWAHVDVPARQRAEPRP